MRGTRCGGLGFDWSNEMNPTEVIIRFPDKVSPATLSQIAAFEDAESYLVRKVADRRAKQAPAEVEGDEDFDTLLVPARPKNWARVGLGLNEWHWVRVSPTKMSKIKHLVAYQTSPVQAVTHVADVDQSQIETNANGKSRLPFIGKARRISPIPLGDAPKGFLQMHRYCKLADLLKAISLVELFGEKEPTA
jgi:hypothetical protein